MGRSLWGGSDDPAPEVQPQPDAKADPMQNMILGMIAKNPMLASAFTDIQKVMQQYLDTVARIEEKQDRILSLLMGMNRDVSAAAPPTPFGEPRGVIADGVRCPWCGSAGECAPNCPSHGDAAGSGAAGTDNGGGDGGGGVGNLNSGGDTVPAASGTGA